MSAEIIMTTEEFKAVCQKFFLLGVKQVPFNTADDNTADFENTFKEAFGFLEQERPKPFDIPEEDYDLVQLLSNAIKTHGL